MMHHFNRKPDRYKVVPAPQESRQLGFVWSIKDMDYNNKYLAHYKSVQEAYQACAKLILDSTKPKFPDKYSL